MRWDATRTSGAYGEGVVVVPHGRAGVGAPERAVERARRAVLHARTTEKRKNNTHTSTPKTKRTALPASQEERLSKSGGITLYGSIAYDGRRARLRARGSPHGALLIARTRGRGGKRFGGRFVAVSDLSGLVGLRLTQP